MHRIDSHSQKIDFRNAKSNPDGPKLTSSSEKAIPDIPVSPKPDSQMPKMEYTFRIAAESGLKIHTIYS